MNTSCSTALRTPKVLPKPTAIRIEPHHGPDKYPRLRNDILKIMVNSDGCWEWIGDAADDHHIRLYELLFDPLEKGLALKPVCHTVGCVCPFHMKVVQAREIIDWNRYVPSTKDFPDLPRLSNPIKDMPKPIFNPKPKSKSKSPSPAYAIPTKKDKEAKQAKIDRVKKENEPIVLPEVPAPVKSAQSSGRMVGVKSCFRGHSQTPENQYVYPNGKRKECLICKRMRDKKK